jgi:hypothetical protein
MHPVHVLATLGAVSVPVGLGFAIAWWNARTEARHLRDLVRVLAERRDVGTAVADPGRLEQAVDAMALEVERLSEGQRFVARLLVDRSASDDRPQLRSAAAGRVVTPH